MDSKISLPLTQGNIAEEGKLLRVGMLAVVDALSVRHRRKIFLFENSLILAKIKKAGKTSPTGSDTFHFMGYYRVSDLGGASAWRHIPLLGAVLFAFTASLPVAWFSGIPIAKDTPLSLPGM